MKAIARSLVVVLVALISVPALVVSVTITAAVQLLATTALIMGGTQHPLSASGDTNQFVNDYFGQATGNFIVPGSNPPGTIDTYAVVYPAEFAPVFGTTTFDDSVDAGVSNLGACLGATGGICTVNHNAGVNSPAADPPAPADTHFVVFGYSQSAVVASLVKNQLIDGEPGTSSALDGTEFYLISNPMRPNGGILGRGFQGTTIPLIGITFYGPVENSCPTADPCTSADTGSNVYPTVDVAQQYDLLGGDAPAVPWNLLAWANSAAAYYYLHGNVPSQSIDPNVNPNVVDQGTYGDTHYYLLTSDVVPLLMPLEQAGVPKPILLVANAPLKVLIEAGYYRETSPGQNVPFQLLPEKDPITLAVNLAKSIPVGIDDGLEAAGVGRALGTAPVTNPYGVGGADPNPNQNLTLNAASEGSSTPQLKLAPEPPESPLQPEPSGTEKKFNSHSNLAVLGGNPDLRGNVPSVGTLPDGAKPDPFRQLRESLKFDPPKPPTGLRPNGDGPLKKIINKLTGQPDAESKPADAA